MCSSDLKVSGSAVRQTSALFVVQLEFVCKLLRTTVGRVELGNSLTVDSPAAAAGGGLRIGQDQTGERALLARNCL